MKKRLLTEELPCWLNAKDVAEYLGLGLTATYELLRSQGFPAITIGKRRIIVHREKFLEYLAKKLQEKLNQKEE